MEQEVKKKIILQYALFSKLSHIYSFSPCNLLRVSVRNYLEDFFCFDLYVHVLVVIIILGFCASWLYVLILICQLIYSFSLLAVLRICNSLNQKHFYKYSILFSEKNVFVILSRLFLILRKKLVKIRQNLANLQIAYLVTQIS